MNKISRLILVLLAMVMAAEAYASNTRTKGVSFTATAVILEPSGLPITTGTPLATVNGVASSNAAAYASGRWAVVLTNAEANANTVEVIWTHADADSPVLVNYGMWDVTVGVPVSAGGITTASFAAGAIDATAISTDAIGAAEVAASAIGAAELAADSIGASEIATDAFTADELAAAFVTEVQSGLATATLLDDVQDDVLDIPTNAEFNARLGTPAGASVSADIAAIESQTDDIGTAGAGLTDIEVTAVLTDVDQEPVPTSRIFELLPDDDEGLVAEKAKVIVIGADPNTYAVEFKADMPTNGRIATVSAPTISSGEAGGITFANLGRDKSQAKFRPTAVTAGEYEVRVEVTYTSGASAVGTIRFTVVE